MVVTHTRGPWYAYLAAAAAGGDSEQERQKLRAHAQRVLWPAVLQRLEQFVRELEAS